MLRRKVSYAARVAAAGLSACMVIQPASVLAETTSEAVTESIEWTDDVPGEWDEWEEEVQEDWNLALTLTAAVTGDETADMINEFLKEGNIRLLMGSKDAVGLLNLLVEEKGEDLFRFLGSVDDEKLRLALPDVSDQVYTIALASLAAQVADSVNTSVNIGGQQLPETVDPVTEISRLMDVLTPYLEAIAGALDESTTIEDNVEIQLFELDKDVPDGSMLYCEPSFAQTADLFSTLADMISEDEALAELTADWAEILEEMYEQQRADAEEAATEDFASDASYEENDLISDLAETADDLVGDSVGQITPEMIETVRNFTENAPEVLRQGAEVFGEYSDRTAFSFTAGGAEDGLVLMDFTLDTGNYADEYYEGAPVFILHLENYQGSYSLSTSYDGEELRLYGTYAEEDDRLQGQSQFDANGEEVMTCEYDFDLTQYSTLCLPYGELIVRIGSFYADLQIGAGENGDDHTLMVGATDITEGITAAAVRLNSRTDILPDAPEGKEADISEYDEEQLNDLANTLLTGTISTFISKLGTAFTGQGAA